MSNFVCKECGFTNIDCGKDGYKTPREIELEEQLKLILDTLIKESPKHKGWIMKHWGYLYAKN